MMEAPRRDRTPLPDETQCNAHSDDASTEILDLLGDEYTRTILEAICEQSRSGSEVAEVTDVSRPTAFRRLNRLVDAGLVAVQQRLDPDDGHHHKEYRAVIDTVAVSLDGPALDVTLEETEMPGQQALASRGVSAGD